MTLRLIFDFPRNYEIKPLSAAPPLHPIEKLYHYPLELEEGDRAGLYLRIEPHGKTPWTGFFAQGFDSDQALNAICTCPHPDWLCAISGGYAYAVRAPDPEQWFRIEQRPVTTLRVIKDQNLVLFAGFTSITALGVEGIEWTTERLSWEGISIQEVSGTMLRGLGWDAIIDKEVPFEVDLRTGKQSGGTRPHASSGRPTV